MSVFVTGDIHGTLNIGKLKARNFDASGLGKDDYVIVVGDFGLVWYPESNHGQLARENAYYLDWLNSRPWTTLFIDGNHENHDLLDAMPIEEWHGGDVHFIRDSVIHLMRGQVFDIDGATFFTMGGAASLDRWNRTPGVSWWERELPDDDEKQEALFNLESAGWEVDFVLTHDAPSKALYELAIRTRQEFSADGFENWLQYNVESRLTYRQWFFGHFHEDFPYMKPVTPLYDVIYDIDEGMPSSRMSLDDGIEIPEPEDPRGYRIDEMAKITGTSIEDAEAACAFAMPGSSVAVAENGDMLVYAHDFKSRILPLL